MLRWYIFLLHFFHFLVSGPYCSTFQTWGLVGLQLSGQKRQYNNIKIIHVNNNTRNLLSSYCSLFFNNFLFVLLTQEDFYAIIDWAWKVDPLRCISMYGITERYLSGQKTDAAGFVHKLLDDLRSKIVSQFNKVWLLHMGWDSHLYVL